MWEDIAGDMAGDALLGGTALCQRRYLGGTMAMHDPCQGKDIAAARGQRKTSKKEGAAERNPYMQTHHPALPITSPEELGGTEREGWWKQGKLRLGRCLA